MVVPVLGFLVLGTFGLLYVYDVDWYFRILTATFAYPFRYPFVDAQYMLALGECWQRGVDVYVHNPCDIVNQRYNYSPLWLRLTFLPTDLAWTNWVGLTLDSAFLISLAFLPSPRGIRDLALIVVTTFSPMTVFALERANIDLIMFVLVVLAALCLERGFFGRLAGYLAIVLAGLLKFYPFVLLLLLLRERMARFLILAAAAMATIAGFAWQYHDELVRAIANIPTGNYFDNLFGADRLPAGLGTALKTGLDALGFHGEFIDGLPQNASLRTGTWLVLAASTIVTAIRLCGTPGFRSALAAMPPRHANYLVIGAALICGCFFTGESTGYRAIFLLFAMPGMLLLAESGTFAAVHRWTVGAIIYCMWFPPLHHAFDYLRRYDPDNSWGVFGRYANWVVHELAWWWVATVFLAVLFRFVLDSTVWLTLWNTGSRQRAAL
jgi:hypothetical protein